MDPTILAQVLRYLPTPTDENLLVGIETSDDAAVYRLTDDLAVIQTLDFFTPIVDDPYLYGQIAAANALSDIYAMGGRPILALNIVCFPNHLPPGILGEILRGGADKVTEAGASTVGGHSVQDNEPKYGLSVTGLVHPKKIWTNKGAQEGDILLLTKPLGSGILNTAAKVDLLSPENLREAIDWMRMLNRKAAELAYDLPLSAATDITGFGFLGHLCEMAQGSGKDLEIDSSKIPVMSGAREMAEMGMIPSGAYRNREHVAQWTEMEPTVPLWLQDLMVDPQTSGGLLLSLPPPVAAELQKRYEAAGVFYAIVGRVLGSGGRIHVI